MRNPEPRACRAAIVLIFLGSTLGVTAQDCDTDGDGLSDFQERHKYFTNPQKADSDGDGIADSDWNERREFSYTVRSVLHVMPPYNLAAMNDDYQDVRMLDEHTDYLEVEVIHYPFNTCQVAIEANPNWRQEYASMREYLDPDVTTNWNKRMQRMLRSRLNSDGIDVTALTDREVALESDPLPHAVLDRDDRIVDHPRPLGHRDRPVGELERFGAGDCGEQHQQDDDRS